MRKARYGTATCPLRHGREEGDAGGHGDVTHSHPSGERGRGKMPEGCCQTSRVTMSGYLNNVTLPWLPVLEPATFSGLPTPKSVTTLSLKYLFFEGRKVTARWLPILRAEIPDYLPTNVSQCRLQTLRPLRGVSDKPSCSRPSTAPELTPSVTRSRENTRRDETLRGRVGGWARGWAGLVTFYCARAHSIRRQGAGCQASQ